MFSEIQDCKVYDLLGCKEWKVQGLSVAGERTGYRILGPNILIDGGMRAGKRQSDAYFLTHRHIDHISDLPCNVSYRIDRAKGQENLVGRPLFMPAEDCSKVANFLNAINILCGKPVVTTELEQFAQTGYHPFPVTEHSGVLDIPGIPTVKVEVLKGHHDDCISYGYGFSRVKKCLDPKYESEFAQLDQKGKGLAIKKLVSEGISVNIEVVEPIVAIYGDTTPDALLCHEEWRKYPNIFIECTRTDFETDQEKAKIEICRSREHGHTHINELLPILEQNPGPRWFIHHTSPATNTKAFKALFENSKVKDYVLVIEGL